MRTTLSPKATPVGDHAVTGHSFRGAAVTRPGAMDAYSKPSLVNGKQVPRTRPVLVGSRVPPGKINVIPN